MCRSFVSTVCLYLCVCVGRDVHSNICGKQCNVSMRRMPCDVSSSVQRKMFEFFSYLCVCLCSFGVVVIGKRLCMHDRFDAHRPTIHPSDVIVIKYTIGPKSFDWKFRHWFFAHVLLSVSHFFSVSAFIRPAVRHWCPLATMVWRWRRLRRQIGIFIELSGKAHCQWTDGTGNKKVTIIADRTYLDQRIYLVGERNGKSDTHFHFIRFFLYLPFSSKLITRTTSSSFSHVGVISIHFDFWRIQFHFFFFFFQLFFIHT